MVVKKKSAPVKLGLFCTTDIKHEVGGKKYRFKKDEELTSDTPEIIVSHLERLGLVVAKKEEVEEDAE